MRPRTPEHDRRVTVLLLLALLVWIVFAVLGLVIKALVWLAVIGIGFFVVTGIVLIARAVNK